jgi:hypothetical protein
MFEKEYCPMDRKKQPTYNCYLGNIPILSPIIQREILYRLLVGDQGTRFNRGYSCWFSPPLCATLQIYFEEM